MLMGLFSEAGGSNVKPWKEKGEKKTKGEVLEGEILDIQVRDVHDDEGNVVTFKSGNPKKQFVLTIQTSEITEEDDGKRRFFVNWAGKPRDQFQKGIDDFGRDPEVGDIFKVRWNGKEDVSDGKKSYSLNLYEYKFLENPNPTAKAEVKADAKAEETEDDDF